MAYSIREGTALDAPAVAAIWLATQHEEHNEWPDEETLNEFARDAADPKKLFLVVDGSEEVIGLVVAILAYDDDVPEQLPPDVIHIASIAMAPLFCGRGIGTALIRETMDRARALGCTRMQLWTHEANHRAQRFYERLGFTPTGRSQADNYDPQSLIVQYAASLCD